MTHPFEVTQVADQQLPAPNCPVGAVATPIEHGANDRAKLTVLGKTGGQMGMMVLHGDALHSVTLTGESSREVIGVRIVRDHLRDDGEQPLKMLNSLPEGSKRLVVLQVAD